MLAKEIIKILNEDIDYELMLNGEIVDNDDFNTINAEVISLDIIGGSLIIECAE